jgi:hypothetical protein
MLVEIAIEREVAVFTQPIVQQMIRHPSLHLLVNSPKTNRAAIFATTDCGTAKKTRNDYHNRNRKFIDFLFQNYNDSYETSTVLISDDARADPNNY